MFKVILVFLTEVTTEIRNSGRVWGLGVSVKRETFEQESTGICG